ncbi:MAG: Aspartate-semialdehyde dehydrogenase [Candidatus Rifleibacterium amylolyticum]|nr:MAG: Aspartate-semialdehyde dehydrogenase [Candidatus Rifleibacterium amylolyticum]
MNKIKVGVLGATGMVGQQYISLLAQHPWFEVAYVAASPASAGKTYRDAVAGRWQMVQDVPPGVAGLVVQDANNPALADNHCVFVFSALDMDKQAARELEDAYATRDIPVVSNASAHRGTDDVPMLIPEINHEHINVIAAQRSKRGWQKGFIAVKPNCSLQSYMTPVFALLQAGYEIRKMIITTMQAVSGAGYPGVPSLDMVDNIVPFIGGEEEKSEVEPHKILGRIVDGRIVSDDSIKISAHCNRVPVIDGHTACVSLEFGDNKPSLEEIKRIWHDFKSLPQQLKLSFAPVQPIIYREEANRPQPRKDRDADKGMAVSVGRLRKCNVFDIRFVGLSHNTVRGAAGGGILNAELLKAKGYFD